LRETLRNTRAAQTRAAGLSAVLQKLGVPTRRDAAARAAELESKPDAE